MTNIISNQAMNGVITFAGVKGDFSKLSAKNDILTASLHSIIDGNSRPFDDTKQAIPKGLVIDKEASQHAIGLSKTGNVKAYKYASNMQGVVLAAIIAAAKTSRMHYEALHLNGVNSKNLPKYDKKLSAADKDQAAQHAAQIAADFILFCDNGAANLTASKNQAADKTKATKAEKAAAIESAAASEQAAAEVIAQKAAADTLTISEFLANIKGGNSDALALALLVSNALSAYNKAQSDKQAAAVVSATNKAAAAIDTQKRAKANKQVVQKELAA